MKKILLLIVSVILIASFVDTKAQVNDWKWSNPRPTGETMRWCQMIDANTWYAAGYYGMFVKTTDGGTTWKSMCAGIRDSTGGNESVYGGYFFNANTGLLCGSGYMGTNTNRGIIRTTDAGNTWVAVGPNTSASYYKFSFINTNTGFVCGATTRDVNKTTDGGLTWTDVSGNIGGSTKYCIYAINENIIMVGESSADIWRTTNGGTNWTEINNSGGTTYGINFIDANTGFMCGSLTMTKKTTNGGLTWTTVTTGAPTSTFEDIDFKTSVAPPAPAVFTATSTNVTILPTGAGGTYWDSVVIGAPLGVITDVQVGVDTLLHTWISDMELTLNSPSGTGVKFFDNRGGSGDNIIHAIFDDSASNPISGGSAPFTGTWIPDNPLSAFIGDTLKGTWKLKMQDFYYGDGGSMRRWWVKYNYMTFGGLQATVYITGNPFNIYKSTDLGTTWDTVGFLQHGVQTITSTYYETSFSSTGDTLFTVGGWGFMNVRYNASNRVFHHKDKKVSGTLNCIGIVGNNIIAGGSSGNVVYSTDRGVNWDSTDISGASTLRGVSMINNNNAWICGSSGKTYKTSNGGASWTEVTNPATSTLYNVSMIDANTGWVVGSSGKVCKTINGGTTWTTQTSTMGTSTIYGASFINANTGWVCGLSGKVSKTTNGGTNWTAQTSNFHSTLRGIDFVDGNNGYMCGSYSCVRGTTDGGSTWDTLHLPFSYNISLYALDFYDKWNGLIVGHDGRTFRTRDAGTTWVFENTAAYSMYSVCMASTDSAFGGCSYGNIIQYGELLTGTGTYTHQVPEVYELYQNYPNPFNPTTTIQFALPKDGMVSLKIYDVSGRLVNTLINNEGLNEGTFKYIFNGSNLASGVYFYSLLVDDNLIDSKKMVLIK